MIDKKKTALNCICPYFTMFPLDFPYTVLASRAQPGEWVLDPFCGRGTTNYAGRMLGLPSLGIDSSPVAVALSEAKLANTTPALILQAAQHILEEVREPIDVPTGEFWEWAFHEQVLLLLGRLRTGLLRDCTSEARKALRAIMLGALHGPRNKHIPSYFSNQSPRTYAPKPRYAVQFWKARELRPQEVDVLHILQTRAERYYAEEKTFGVGKIIEGDSRENSLYTHLSGNEKVRWVITSPPYYGMRTYLPDQWLRFWFLGGSSEVTYSNEGQLGHASPAAFTQQLRAVWHNVAGICTPEAKLVIRFGAIHDRNIDALTLITQSLQQTGWILTETRPAGSATRGKRQSQHFFQKEQQGPIEEHDIWAVLR